MKNKKGFTLIEVIVSVLLVSIIMVSMLSSLVKLRELYSEINKNSDVLVYSSSISRIINNDLINNNGIKYATCNSEGTECEFILGNDKKRKLQLTFKYDDTVDGLDEIEDKEILVSRNSVSTLSYLDTTESESKILYIRTLDANIYTTYENKEAYDRKELKYTTSDGYNFLNMNTHVYTENSDSEKKDVITNIRINIYDGIDETDGSYAAQVYTSGRYAVSYKRGQEYRIELDDNGATERGTGAIDEVYGVGYFASDTSHSLSDIITSITPPKKEGYMFAGYYYDANIGEKVAIIDSEGKIIVASNYFEAGESLSDSGVGRVQAVWDTCTGGYDYNRDTGECKQKEYEVKLDHDGGTSPVNTITAKYKTLIPNVPVPVKSGYIFNGYYTGPNRTGKQYYNSSGEGIRIWEEIDWNSETNKLYASWTSNQDTPYRVEHWKQKIGAADEFNETNYEETEVENLTGTTGTTVSPERKSYVGFDMPAQVQITISGDGNTLTRYYYRRKKYTVSLSKGTGISSVSGAGTYQYGQNANISANVLNEYDFKNWTDTSNNVISTYINYNFDVTGNLTLKANGKSKIITYEDLIQHYSCENKTVGTDYIFSYTGCCEVLNDGGDNWKIKLLGSCSSKSGLNTLKFKTGVVVDAFLVGGGGAAGTGWGGGGGGGYTDTFPSISINPDTSYEVYVGAGGTGGTCAYNEGYLCNKGSASSGEATWFINSNYKVAGGYGGNCGQNAYFGSGHGTCTTNTSDAVFGGQGGSAGGSGWTDMYCQGMYQGVSKGNNYSYLSYKINGQNHSTCEFSNSSTPVETCPSGYSTYYSAGGNGGCCYDLDDYNNLICYNGSSGANNTGNGASARQYGSYNGGSGIIIIRNKR